MGYGKRLISNSMSPPVAQERKISVHRKRSLSGHFGRLIGSPAKGRILEGLLVKAGKTCLPVEDICRIQNLVEPKFAKSDSSATIKTCKNGSATELSRKKAILEYLTSGVEKVRIQSESDTSFSLKTEEPEYTPPAPVENFIGDLAFDISNQPIHMVDGGMQPEVPDQTEIDPKLAEVFDHIDNMQLETATPLSELERMKSLLPEVKVESKGLANDVNGGPVSPANSLSSNSSKESEDDPLNKKPLLAYNGIGQIRLWQFLVQCLANGEHGICWTNKKTLEFKFTYPDAIARAWGKIKNKDTMTYDKMSRSLRFYYKKNILKKVHDQKYMFQFHPSVQKICANILQNSA